MAKFLGFVQFYSRFIPNFEIRVEALRTVTKQDYTVDVGPHWTPEAQAAWEDLKGAILADPCIQRFDHRKLIVLRSDFSAKGFGYVLLQPGKDEASTNAAKDYLEGKGFNFMTKDSKAILHPVCFGARRTRGNEVRLHSHLGERFSGDYAINKCHSYVFGQRFVWVMDCYAIKFILSYEGGNPAILRLQMCLMCWDVDIVHCPDSELVDVDYWSWLGVDIKFNPLFQEYLEYTRQIRHSNPAPIDLPMRPENMPYYRGPRFQRTHSTESSNADALHIQSLLADITTSTGWGHTHLQNVPVHIGDLAQSVDPPQSRPLLNSELALYACQSMHYNWAMYSFSNGHFSSSIESHGLPFTICHACDTSEAGCSLFNEFATKATVFSSGNDLLNHIRASGHQSVISGYLINSYCFQTSEITSSFWKLQLSIIAQLRLIRLLSIVVAVVIPNHDGRAVRSFIKGLESAHWKVSRRADSYLEIGDSISDSCSVITAVHSSCASKVEPLVLNSPPTVPPRPLSSFIWMPFDRPEHAIGYGQNDIEFNKDDTCKLTATTPKPANPSTSPGVVVQYHLHRHDQDATILAGSSVLSRESVYPPFESCPNKNLFQQFFGIEFHHDDHTYVRAISTYEFSHCFGLVDNIQYWLSHDKYKFGLDAAMPGRTSSWIFDQVHSHLVYLRDANSEIFSPNQFAAPRPQFRLSSTAPFAPAFLQRSGGSRHIPPTLNYARFVTSH